MAPPPLVYPGERYGELEVLWLETKRVRRNRVYRTQCSCGAHHSVTAADLRDGRVRSCGHLRVEAGQRIGRDPQYADWRFGGALNPVQRRA